MKAISGKNINLRLVEIEDADFVYKLRTDSEKTKYLNQVKSDINTQKSWLVEYKKRERLGNEYYFLIEDKAKIPLGLVRLYDFKEDSFCWGSFITIPNAPYFTAIETTLCVYEFAFYELKFIKSHFDVRKQNSRVVAFHKRFGAKIVAEDELNFYFEISKKDYEKSKLKYTRFLKEI